MQWKYLPDGVVTVGERLSQKDISDPQMRREHLQGAFEVQPAFPQAARVLLLDDLYASGATLHELAKLLTTSTQAFVYAFTITRSRRAW